MPSVRVSSASCRSTGVNDSNAPSSEPCTERGTGGRCQSSPGTVASGAAAGGRRPGRQVRPGPQPGSGRGTQRSRPEPRRRFNEATRGPTMANLSEAEHLLDLITGYWVARAIHAAARLGIADLLEDGPRAVGELARERPVRTRASCRLLRGLAGRGPLPGRAGEHVRAHPPGGAPAGEDHPCRCGRCRSCSATPQYHPWGDLLYSIETGRCAYERRAGEPFFDSLAKDTRHAARTFSRAMTSFLQSIPASVVEVGLSGVANGSWMWGRPTGPS